MRRTLTSLLTVAAAVVSSLALVGTPASAATAGQLCKSADVGKTQDGLKCTKDGSRFRWAAGAATTKAPATNAPTTKKSTATTKKSTATTKKSTGTTKASTASSGSGVVVNGRFCAAADKGRRGTDAKGRKLTCKGDANGKNRWQE